MALNGLCLPHPRKGAMTAVPVCAGWRSFSRTLHNGDKLEYLPYGNSHSVSLLELAECLVIACSSLSHPERMRASNTEVQHSAAGY